MRQSTRTVLCMYNELDTLLVRGPNHTTDLTFLACEYGNLSLVKTLYVTGILTGIENNILQHSIKCNQACIVSYLVTPRVCSGNSVCDRVCDGVSIHTTTHPAICDIEAENNYAYKLAIGLCNVEILQILDSVSHTCKSAYYKKLLHGDDYIVMACGPSLTLQLVKYIYNYHGSGISQNNWLVIYYNAICNRADTSAILWLRDLTGSASGLTYSIRNKYIKLIKILWNLDPCSESWRNSALKIDEIRLWVEEGG